MTEQKKDHRGVMGLAALLILVVSWRDSTAGAGPDGAIALHSGTPTVVEATEFRLVGDNGERLAVLRSDKERIFLDLGTTISLTAFREGGASITVRTPKGQNRASLLLAPDGTAGLHISDAETGKMRAGLGVGPDGTAKLALCDQKGDTKYQRWILP